MLTHFLHIPTPPGSAHRAFPFFFPIPQWAGEASLSPCCAPTHLRCAGVPPGLLASPNAPAPGSLRSPFACAPTHLRCAGVPLGLFGKPKRSSFSRFAASIKPYYGLFSKTLDLQPLRGLRWAGEASLPPAPLSPTTRALRDGRTLRNVCHDGLTKCPSF